MLPKEALPQVRVKMVEEEVMVEDSLRIRVPRKASDLLLELKAERDERAIVPAEVLDQEVKTEVTATIVAQKGVAMVPKRAMAFLLDQRVLNQVVAMVTAKIREVTEKVSLEVTVVVDTHLPEGVDFGIRVEIVEEREVTIKQKLMNLCLLKGPSLLQR